MESLFALALNKKHTFFNVDLNNYKKVGFRELVLLLLEIIFICYDKIFFYCHINYFPTLVLHNLSKDDLNQASRRCSDLVYIVLLNILMPLIAACSVDSKEL